MNVTEKQLDAFFYNYAARFNDALNGKAVNIEATASAYASCFIAANPSGVSCGKNDEDFKKAISEGYNFYKHIGIISMNIISKEIISLNDYHVLVKIKWKSTYIKQDKKREIDFSVIYFLQLREDQIKVFAYITDDEQKALNEAGLI